ncbi:MAG TPA: hypothetical protein VG013_06105 [Gemmataceae bacterium]|nr:hypothetical protein [Gemmataceae bacterium]
MGPAAAAPDLARVLAGWPEPTRRAIMALVDTARPPAIPSEADFDRAFDWLDGRAGGHNCVGLANLRQDLPADRTDFDALVRRLRRASRYRLAAAEGRHGITAEEKAAGILEDGRLLLYVSRKSP